jgi:pyrroloquinoline-quinone synthase
MFIICIVFPYDTAHTLNCFQRQLTVIGMNKEFIGEINAILKEKSLLQHPFYKMWLDGTLSSDAMEYYTLEATFPSFLLKLNSYNPSEEDKKTIMENYGEETAKGRAHADMWLDFAVGLGLKRKDVKQFKPSNSTNDALNQIKSLTDKSYLSGIAALLAYEANLQETSATKIDSLRDQYGISDKKAVAFFAVHGILDIKHSNDWKEFLAKNATTPQQQKEVKKAVSEAMDALWHFLDGINEKYNTPSTHGVSA